MNTDLRTRIADEISSIQVGSGYESTTIGITAALEAADALIAAGVVSEEPEVTEEEWCETCLGSGQVAVGPWGVRPPKVKCPDCDGVWRRD